MAAAAAPAIPFGPKEKFAYAFGYLGVSLLTFAVSQWLQSYYVPTSGGAPLLPTAAAFGTALVVGRIIDGFADPLAGYLSDTARTPIGRRRPFLLIFGPLAGLCFALLFPRVAPGEQLPVAVFIGTLCAYYLTYTLAVTPYLALLPDLAAAGTARLGITTYQTVFNFAGIAIAMLLGGQIRTDPMMAPILGAVGGFALMVPGLVLREPPLARREAHEEQPSIAGMFRELGMALQNRVFLLYVASQLCMWFGFNMILAWLPYVVERLMHGPSVTVANLAALGTALVLLPVALQVVKRIGKIRGLMFAMSAFAIGFILLSQLGRLSAPPIDLEKVREKRAKHGRPAAIEEIRKDFEPSELTGDPATPNLRWPVGLAILCGLGLPLAIFFITPNAILSDVIDLDRAVHGPGREGMFFAAQAVVIQSGGAASGWVLNRVLTGGGEQATVAGIAAVGPVAAAIIVVGVFIMARFRRRMGEGTIPHADIATT